VALAAIGQLLTDTERELRLARQPGFDSGYLDARMRTLLEARDAVAKAEAAL
jgi:hypothetical protein